MAHRQSMIKRTNQALAFIKSYIVLNDEPPTLVEIGEFFGFTSPSTIFKILKAMENRGMIKRDRKWRGITIVA